VTGGPPPDSFLTRTIASSKASTASPGESFGTPMSEIRSHSPPAPMPRMTRPPDSADSDVTVRASMGAGRVGRFETLAKPVMRSVRPRMKPIAA
jgi:hypothetical protein